MIVVDTSALLAILLKEPAGEACLAALAVEEEIILSAGTMAEALIVAAARNIGDEMARLIEEVGLEVVPLTPAAARRVAGAYAAWGKGVHPAGLNFGDCFAYELAKERDCALLYVGQDFAKTDVATVL